MQTQRQLQGKSQSWLVLFLFLLVIFINLVFKSVDHLPVVNYVLIKYLFCWLKFFTVLKWYIYVTITVLEVTIAMESFQNQVYE